MVQTFPIGSTYQQQERKLPLTIEDLKALQLALTNLGNKPTNEVHNIPYQSLDKKEVIKQKYKHRIKIHHNPQLYMPDLNSSIVLNFK
ncbi:MAG: hypothetical protein ACI9SD_001929 [Pseudohongiellaceae bacterium]|jgi:hypothetical protein